MMNKKIRSDENFISLRWLNEQDVRFFGRSLPPARDYLTFAAFSVRRTRVKKKMKEGEGKDSICEYLASRVTLCVY